MAKRFYIAPRTGAGTIDDPYHSILRDILNANGGGFFDEMINFTTRNISLCCVTASDTVHAAIVADGRSLPVCSKVADDFFPQHLDSLISDLPNLAELKLELEQRGISTSWYSASNTVRDGIRWIVRLFGLSQIADGQGNGNIKDIITRNLDTTVGNIPAQIRNGVRNWMQARGLATGWINNSTTVREILHFIVQNLGFGKFRMTGEDF